MRLGAGPNPSGPERAPDGTSVQLVGSLAFTRQYIVQVTIVASLFGLWAWLKAGGTVWIGAVVLVALIASHVATGLSILRVARGAGIWVPVDGPGEPPEVVVLRSGPIGHLGIASADGMVDRVPGSLHRAAPVVKIRARLVTDGIPRWQRLTWDPAAESIMELARRVQAAHPSDTRNEADQD